MQVSKDLGNGITIHGFQTGTVAVKKEHFAYSGWGPLRFPKILYGNTWMPEMPIWAWTIDSPTGKYLVDTGESTAFYQPDHFTNEREGSINRKILKIKVERAQEIDQQLQQIGWTTDQIDAVLMTHLHLDHTDGIKYFPKAKFIISPTDWAKPIGVPLSTFPTWFKADQIDLQTTELPFSGEHRFSDSIRLVGTPGHTFGHQSVLIEAGAYTILLAGDTTFNEEQLRQQKIAGINLDIKQSRQTLQNIRQLCRETQVVYLPSHDPESGERLMALQPTRV